MNLKSQINENNVRIHVCLMNLSNVSASRFSCSIKKNDEKINLGIHKTDKIIECLLDRNKSVISTMCDH